MICPVIPLELFFTKEIIFKKLFSMNSCCFHTKFVWKILQTPQNRRDIFQNICVVGWCIFNCFRENSHGQTKSLYLIKTNFLILTKVFNEEQLMLWNIFRMETTIAFDFLYYDLWIEVRIFWNFYKFWFSVSCLIFIDFYPIMEHEFSHFQSVISCGPLRFFLNFYYVSHDLSNKFWKFCAISFIFREERIFSWKWDFEKSLVGVRP